MEVYWSSIEYLYDAEHPESSKLKGGFVYCFVRAATEPRAFQKINAALAKEKLSVKVIEFVRIYDKDTEWETAEQTANYNQLSAEAKNSDEAIFDVFYAYETD
jgi:hypothetical protein